MPKIHLDGFHFHSFCNNLDSNLHVDVSEIFILKKQRHGLKKHRFPLKHINLGGGIGVNYADLNANQFDLIIL